MRRLRVCAAAGAAVFTLLSTAAGQSSLTASADAAFRAGDFAAAGRGYEAALKTAPLDAGALAGLARVRALQNRNDEAIALDRQALMLDPANPSAKATLRGAELRKAALAGADYAFEPKPSGEVVIPFAATDPLPIVRVAVDGRPAYFVIDTGAPGIVVTPDFAKALGLQIQSAGVGVFAGGRRAPVARAVLPDLRIGALRISNAPAGVIGGGLKLGRFDTAGVIGTSFLMQFLPTLDYCRGRLVLRPRSASAAFERAAARSGANRVPMWLFADHFIFARGRIGRGAEHLYSIDTGMAGGGLGATKATLEEASVPIDSSKAVTGVGGGGRVSLIPFRASATLGAMTVAGVPGLYSPNGDPYGIFPFHVAGTLSHMFFRHSRLTFDFDAMRLVTQACAA